MPFTIVRQDITNMRADAIVNAANTALAMGGGACGAIFRAAGVKELQAACERVAPIRIGEAAITPGFALCKYIIHAAGPVYRRYDVRNCERQLYSAYRSSLNLALEHKCESIAFPLISSGIYGYPKAEALSVARTAILDFLEEHELDVYLVVFDASAFEVSKALLGSVESYIDENYIQSRKLEPQPLLDVEVEALRGTDLYGRPASADGRRIPQPPTLKIDEWVENLDAPFSEALLKLIVARGKTDAEVYKRANIDRKLFSKIRAKGYTPSKRTALALAIALELSLAETGDLLSRAGYALSHSQKFDVIVEYFILRGKYNIFDINEVLFRYELPLLGA